MSCLDKETMELPTQAGNKCHLAPPKTQWSTSPTLTILAPTPGLCWGRRVMAEYAGLSLPGLLLPGSTGEGGEPSAENPSWGDREAAGGTALGWDAKPQVFAPLSFIQNTHVKGEAMVSRMSKGDHTALNPKREHF